MGWHYLKKATWCKCMGAWSGCMNGPGSPLVAVTLVMVLDECKARLAIEATEDLEPVVLDGSWVTVIFIGE